jgi:hypothetical protein
MDPRDPRDPRNVGAIDPRDLRGDPRDTRSGIMDPRDHMRGVLDPIRGDVSMRDPRDMRGMGDIRGGDPMLRGDPRGISGRLNGGSDAGMWGQPPQPPHHHAPHHQQSQPPGKMVGPGAVSGSGEYRVKACLNTKCGWCRITKTLVFKKSRHQLLRYLSLCK